MDNFVIKPGFWKNQIESIGFRLEGRLDEDFMWRYGSWLLHTRLNSPENSSYAMYTRLWDYPIKISYTEIKNVFKFYESPNLGRPLCTVYVGPGYTTRDTAAHYASTNEFLSFLHVLANPDDVPLLVSLDFAIPIIEKICRGIKK